MRPTENPSSFATIDAPRVASGLISVERIGSRSAVTRLKAESPLKLLSPRHGSRISWIIAASYGGGLVAGDRIHLRLDAASGTHAFLGTQASTKVYRAVDGVGCTQQLSINVGEGALCVIAPDPVTPFEGAIYEQRQDFSLHEHGSIVLVDWMTSGRSARGERWDFARYSTRTLVTIGERLRVRDALRLDACDGRLDVACRTGGYDCLATAMLIGPAVAGGAKEVLRQIASSPAAGRARVIFSASSTPGGAIIRAAGVGPEIVGRWLKHQLAFVADLLGEDLWARKW